MLLQASGGLLTFYGLAAIGPEPVIHLRALSFQEAVTPAVSSCVGMPCNEGSLRCS
jgi:hypothetical protein